MTGAQPAHAMSQVHAVGAARALDWAIAHGEDHAVASSKRHHLGPRLQYCRGPINLAFRWKAFRVNDDIWNDSVESRSGPHHAPRFIIAVEIAGVGSARAEAGSKQAAETAAAAALLGQIQ